LSSPWREPDKSAEKSSKNILKIYNSSLLKGAHS
jgi:hypothetical protein